MTWKLYDFEYLLHGGADSAQALHELKLTFLFCCNLSTILLVLIVIEKEIAGLLYLIGLEHVVKMRLELLLQKALQMQCITQKEFDTFNRLRDNQELVLAFSAANSFVNYDDARCGASHYAR